MTEALQSAPGSVAQVRECAAQLTRFAKQHRHHASLLVGHVTKEGALAGPRVLEHMVDTVLYFEGDTAVQLPPGARDQEPLRRGQRARRVRDDRSRACATSTIRRRCSCRATSSRCPGSCVLVTQEGTRPLLVEVQALVDTAHGAAAASAVGRSRSRTGWRCCWPCCIATPASPTYDQDVFVNAVGGVRITEPAADLAVVLAILSSLRNRPLPARSGRVRRNRPDRRDPTGAARPGAPARSGQARLLASHRAPRQCAEAPIEGLEVVAVERIDQAIDAI